MKNQQPEATRPPTHQTVTASFSFKAGAKTIHIATTEQQLSGHAGQATFWSFLHQLKVPELLSRVLPNAPRSNHAPLSPLDIVSSFVAGVIAGADRLTRVAWLRQDPVLPAIMGTKRVPSQSTFSRFLSKFDARKNLECFGALWRWTMERIKAHRGGYTLDLDTSSLIHEDGHQEGVAVGHTRIGLKPCHQPMLAVLAEAMLCLQFWLRPGNSHCSNNL